MNTGILLAFSKLLPEMQFVEGLHTELLSFQRYCEHRAEYNKNKTDKVDKQINYGGKTSCQMLVEVGAAAGAATLPHTMCTCKTRVGREANEIAKCSF